MKKFLSSLLALMMILSMFVSTAGLNVSAAGGMIGQVSKMGERIQTAKPFDKMPRTFEAVIKLPADYKGRAGVIIGNYKNASTTAISFEINDGGIPRLYYQQDKATFNHVFSQVDIRSNDEPVRLTLVQDPASKTITCYINGEAKQTLNAAANLPDELLPTNAQVVGGDLRADNAQFFKGTIYKINVYADPLTADQVKAGQGTGLLASYDFTAASNQQADLSGNGYDLTGTG